MKTTNIYLDRTELKKLPTKVQTFFINNGLLVGGDKNSISFCGMIKTKDEIFFFFPRGCVINSNIDDERIAVQILMQAILKFGVLSSTSINAAEDVGCLGVQSFASIKKIMDDYVTYGIYTNKVITTMIQPGKINWKQTVLNGFAFPSEKNEPIYLNLYSNKTNYSQNSEVAKIQAGILRNLFADYGWIFGFDDKLVYDLNLIPASYLCHERQRELLNKELMVVYSDREMVLLRNLINFLDHFSGENKSTEILGLTRFHVAWEGMLSKIFRYVVPINKSLPAPVYIDVNGRERSAYQHGMKTDFVLRSPNNNEYVIIDAKYYEATNTNNSPGWSDLVKQFLYERSLELVINTNPLTVKTKISNVFIIPGIKKVFDVIKMKDRQRNIFLDNDFKPIKCLYMNPIDVMKDYVLGVKRDYFAGLNKV